MGPHTLFCRRSALRGSNDHFADSLQAVRVVEHRYYALHLVALPAVGHQAAVEPLCRYAAHEALVDCHHAAAHRCSPGRRSLHHSRLMVATGVAVLLLDDGLCQCHPRHCRRRLLHDGTRRARAGLLRGHSLHVLPHCHHLLLRIVSGSGWRLASHDTQHSLFLEPCVLPHGRTLHCLLALPQLGAAKAG